MSDARGALAVVARLPLAKRLLGDKGHDADWLRDDLKARGVRACRPARNGRTRPATHNRRLHEKRCRIENAFARLKDWRAIAMRCGMARAIAYVLDKDRWPAFSRFLEDGRICLSNSEPLSAIGPRTMASAERALRGVALGRKAWLFAGCDRGGRRAAFFHALIVTAKLNDIDPQAWLADVLARMPSLLMSRLPKLLSWNWAPTSDRQNAA
ncbi:transposase [Rubellimicrobium aerolatum]|nr:transposase [Rubellimicrobium aerolatum]